MKELLKHASTFMTVIVFVATMGWTIIRPLAEDFIQETVKERLSKLEESLRTLEMNDAARAGQLAIQNEQLKNIKTNQDETRTDVKAILRALTVPRRSE